MNVLRVKKGDIEGYYSPRKCLYRAHNSLHGINIAWIHKFGGGNLRPSLEELVEMKLEVL